MNLAIPLARHQRGATLLISLLLLLMLTILAISTARTGALQQRMTSNFQQSSLAYQMAESGISAAILRLSNDKTKPDGTKTLCAEPSNTLPAWNAACPSSEGFYSVEVTKIDCGVAGQDDGDEGYDSSTGAGVKPVGGDSGGCYRIISSGHYADHVAKHLQGVSFKKRK